MSSRDDPTAACPVDHKTREAWLAQARASGNQQANPHNPPTPAPAAPSQPQPQSSIQTSCDSSSLDQTPSSPAPTTPSLAHLGLGTTREISSIPRALPNVPPQPAARAANNEADTGADAKTGNWIYPSERMFFDAMRRKAFDPSAPDMHTIVPIHNAVNERAWHHIKEWEAGRGAEACGGPKLASFSGLSTKLTPRARWRVLMGYQEPFDRHDWVVERCGKEIEYVIDFYAGRDGGQAKGLSFHLDVRPKLNSWEGVKMRVLKFWGF